MQITKKEIKEKYGIDIPKGKFQIYVKNNNYEIYSVKDDTAGCILVGIDKGKDIIYNSRKTFGELMEILQKEKDIEIEILETYGPYRNDFENKKDD